MKLKLLILSAGLMAVACAPQSEARSRWERMLFWQPYDFRYDPGAYDSRDAEDGYYDERQDLYIPRHASRRPDPEDGYYVPRYQEPGPYRDRAPARTEQRSPNTSAVKPKTAAATPPKAPAVSCDKATQIIGGYGFSSIQPQSCKGKVYAFNATRGGKNFSVKLSSATGELTEVKKQP